MVMKKVSTALEFYEGIRTGSGFISSHTYGDHSGLPLPFIGKPSHIDDPLFIWCAGHAQSDPFNFYGFHVEIIGVAGRKAWASYGGRRSYCLRSRLDSS
ncbi:MAG: hypothetical protein ABW298_01780 [Candidatus Binatia bacterium]